MSDSTPQPPPSDRSPTAPVQPAPGRKHHHRIWLVVLALLVLVLLVVGGGIIWRHHGQSVSPTPTPSAGGRGGTGPIMVSTATAQSGNIGVYVNGLGVVPPLSTISVNSRKCIIRKGRWFIWAIRCWTLIRDRIKQR